MPLLQVTLRLFREAVFVYGYAGSSLLLGLVVGASWGYSSHAQPSLCGDFSCGSLGSKAWRRQSCDLRALEQSLSSCGTGLSSSSACGIFPNQGSNLRLLHW